MKSLFSPFRLVTLRVQFHAHLEPNSRFMTQLMTRILWTSYHYKVQIIWTLFVIVYAAYDMLNSQRPILVIIESIHYYSR